MSKIFKVIETLKKSGLRGITNKFNERKLLRKQAEIYQNWVNKFDTLSEKDRQTIQQKSNNLPYKPLISILVPVYNIDEKWLRLCIESVFKQIYPNWELCIADDCSLKPHIRQVLEEFAARDSRLKIIFRTENGHISAASNSALELATGEFTALLDHDDEISEHALFYVVKELNSFPQADLIYSDEDKIAENNLRNKPTLKPDWNADLFYSMNYLNHLTVYRTAVLREAGGFRLGFEGSQDYDLALRVIEKISTKNIRHIPQILYHWRAISGSVALDTNEKSYPHEAARKALSDHFARKNLQVKVEKGFENYHRIKFETPNDTTTKVIQIENPNAEKYNLQAANCSADVLIFIDEKLHWVDNPTLSELTNQTMRDEIGAVGGKILNQDLENFSFGIEIKTWTSFIKQGFYPKYLNALSTGKVVQNVDYVCKILAVRRELFEKLNGFDETKKDFEIDFCQRLRQQNYRILFTPNAVFAEINP